MFTDISRQKHNLCQIYISAIFAGILLGGLLLYLEQPHAGLYWAVFLLCLFLQPRSWLTRYVAPALRAWWGMDRRETRRLLLLSGGAVLAASFIAHGFLFANEFFSHDSVHHFNQWHWTVNGQSDLFKAYGAGSGRFILAPYEGLRGYSTYAPWLIGMLFILWMTLCTVMVVRLLDIRSASGVILTGALLSTSTSLTCIGATFIYCLDEYALSLALAAAAVWLFQRRCLLLGMVCITVSMGIYQAYLCAALVLAFICVIQMAASNRKPLAVIRQGVYYLAALFLGFCLYYGVWTALSVILQRGKDRLSEVTLNGGLIELLRQFREAWLSYFSRYLLNGEETLGAMYPAVTVLILLAVALWTVGCLLDKDICPGNKVLLFLCMLALPAALNISDILFIYKGSDLIGFQTCLLFIFLLCCREHPPAVRLSARQYRAAALALLCIVCWRNVIFSNQAYLKKELVKTSTASLVSRVIARVEAVEGYQPNVTPVLLYPNGYFNGATNLVEDANPYPFRELYSHAGLNNTIAPGRTSYLMEYIHAYLNYPMNLFYDANDLPASIDRAKLLEIIETMPAFPAQGSVALVGEVLVVKLT